MNFFKPKSKFAKVSYICQRLAFDGEYLNVCRLACIGIIEFVLSKGYIISYYMV